MEWMHYDDEWLFRAELCLHEALLNAYQHGNERNAWREIRVTCLLAANNVKIHVEDEGSGYNTAETTNLDALAADHGRGLYLIHQLMNSVRVSKDGKEIIMSLSKE
jgi:anti-sigma regulatory factor (Ser/Thr protein kinase)